MFMIKDKKIFLGVIVWIIFTAFVLRNSRYLSEIELACHVFSGILILTFFYVYKKSNSITVLISTIVFLFLAVVQPLWSILCVEEVNLSGHLLREDLISPQYRVAHIIYISLFFMVFIYAVAYIVKAKRRNTFANILAKSGRLKSFFIHIDPIVIAVIYSVLGSLFLYNTNLLNPISPSRVEHSGIFVYVFKLITVLCWGICFTGINVRSKKSARIISNLLIAILFSLPQMIMGSRSVLFFFVGQLVILEILIIKSRNDGKLSIAKKDIAILTPLLIIGFVVLILSISIGNFYRGDLTHIVPRQFLFNRITGIVDGIITSKYTYANSYNRLPISNLFLLWLFPGKGTNMSLFYSVNLRGQKVSDPNAWARPAYASGLLYAGVFGVIFLALVAAVVLSVLELLIKESLLQDNVFAAAAFGYSYVYIFFTFILEGDADIMFTFLWISVAVIILDAFISIRIKKKE